MTPPHATPDEARAHPDRTLLILAMGALAYALAQTLIVPALPVIQADTGSSQSAATWMLTAFLLSSSVATPIVGRLGDMIGKEKVLLFSLGIFGAGSLICALGSHSIELLISGRIVQGAGGAIFPLCFGVIRDEFPPDKVASSIGTISTTFGIGGGAGLVLAGIFIDHLSVAWMFWFSLGITLIAAWATWRYVPESPVRVDARIDWGGGALLSVALSAVLLGVAQGNAWGWSSARVAALIGGGLVVLALFVAYEMRTDEPMVDMALMRRRAVWAPNLAVFMVGFAMFGSYILIPELVQTASSHGYGFGLSVTSAGLIMLPSALIMLWSGPLSGRMSNRFGSRLPLALGAIAASLAFAMLAWAHGSQWTIALSGIPLGLGIGMALAAMANLVVGAVPQDQTGVAMGVNTIIRNVGGAVGGQVAAALLTARVLSDGVPAESGYTDAFAMSMIAGLIALAACALVPRPGGPRGPRRGLLGREAVPESA
jgi:EmrB/QacA subfamily drug resistance transporter